MAYTHCFTLLNPKIPEMQSVPDPKVLRQGTTNARSATAAGNQQTQMEADEEQPHTHSR